MVRSISLGSTVIALFAVTTVVLLLVHESDSVQCYEYAECLGEVTKKGSKVDEELCCGGLGGSYKKSKGKCKDCPGATPPPFLWSSWTKWDTCCFEEGYDPRYREKNQGERTRSRDCVFGNCDGNGKNAEREKVSRCVAVQGNGDSGGSNLCPVHGQWGDWSEWGRCSAYSECSPGGKEAEKQKNVYGLVKRTRNCDNPAPKHGGAECEGALESTKRCKVAHCPVNGGYCPWKEWSACTKNCTDYGFQPDGRHNRRRSCACPSQAHRGQGCSGPAKEYGVCGDEAYCPLNGKWSAWSEWTECDKACGIGERWRRRTCSPPEFGGTICRGLSREYVLCELRKCPSICDTGLGSGSGSSSDSSSGSSSSSFSGHLYSGSGEPDYNICCPPTHVYVKENEKCCRENITITVPSGSGSGSGNDSGNGSGSGSGISEFQQATSSSGSGSAFEDGSEGSSSGWDESSVSATGSGSDGGFYYDCISTNLGSATDTSSESGDVGDVVQKRRRRSTDHHHHRRHRRRRRKSRNDDYVYYDMEHGDYE